MSDITINEDEVRQEHMARVHQPAHWAYLAAVIGGGTALMVALIAILGGTV
jgi:hypothetical protein